MTRKTRITKSKIISNNLNLENNSEIKDELINNTDDNY